MRRQNQRVSPDFSNPGFQRGSPKRCMRIHSRFTDFSPSRYDYSFLHVCSAVPGKTATGGFMSSVNRQALGFCPDSSVTVKGTTA